MTFGMCNVSCVMCHMPCVTCQKHSFLLFLRGLARYNVHATATSDKFQNIIKKGLKLLRWSIFGLPLTHRVKILHKIKYETSHITHYTSNITYYVEVCKFYKLLVINRMVTFNNSSQLILKNFDDFSLWKSSN